MISHQNVSSSKSLIPVNLVLKVHSLFDVTSSLSTERKKTRPITATLTTSDGCKTKIDLNICRPILKTFSGQIPKIKDEEEEENIEDLIIVWLDKNINQIEEDISKRKIHLRQIINCLKIFNNVDDCFHYIKNIKEEKIFFIMPGSLGKTIINQLNNSSQVLNIYIYCSNKRDHEIWTKQYSKILGIFTIEQDLFIQITKDVSSFFQNNISLDIINSVSINERLIQNLTKDQAKFMWSQILIEILLRLPQTSQSKQNFIQECRRYYKNNDYQQKKINEFERTYSSSNALLWYTKDNFLYRILNKALRTKNILYIFKCRFFIIDIYQQLTKLHQNFLKMNKKKNIITIYRGQLMAADEFIKLKNNINSFISFNTFFSTNYSNSSVALYFAGDGSRRPLFESVYFEIELDLNINETYFADINKVSQNEIENEFLLCLGTVFRIETIEPLNNAIWYVKLVSTNENEKAKLNKLKQYFINELDRASTYLALGKILQDIEDYDKARIYYELLLTELSFSHPDIPGIYSGLGATIISMGNNSKLALKYLRQSLILQLKTFTHNIILFIQTLNYIATVYLKCEKFKIGLTLYQFILEIIDSIQAGSTVSQILKIKAEICNNIGYIYSKTDHFILSLKYYKISLNIERKILSLNHPQIAVTLNNIGMIYLKKIDSETAEKYFREANIIRQKTLPPEYHPDLAQMHNNLGTIQYKQSNFDKALNHFEKALQIQLKCLPSIHPHMAMIYNSIGNVYLGKKDYSMALQMFENSLKIGQQCWPLFHPEISQIYRNIGTTYRYLKNYEKALHNCQKSLEIGLKCLASTHSDLAETYRAVGKIYNVTNNHTLALVNFQNAMDIYIKNPPIDQWCLGTLYEEIGNEYYDKEYYQDALKCFQKALEIYQICKIEESSLNLLYFHLGKAYYQNNDYENALIYYNKCLQLEITNTSKSNFSSLSQIYHAIGETFQELNDYQMSLKNYAKALEIILKDNSSLMSNEKSHLIIKYQKSIETVKHWL